jgi:predicted dehydrogenase
MIQTAVVGAAHIHTRDFVAMLHPRRDIEVKTVWDHDLQRAAQAAAALGSEVAATGDLEVVLADPEVTAVVIASENVRHTELVAACAQAGKHVFVDKPLAIASVDAYLLAETVQRAGVIFQTGYLRRGWPAVRFLRDEIGAGNFGTVTRVRVLLAHSGALDGWFDDRWRWMADPCQAGFGAFGDVGTHAVDLLRWLLADTSPVTKVTATVGAVIDKYPGCDEFGQGLLVLEDGTQGSVAAAWTDRAAPVHVEVAGTCGYAELANGQLRYQSERVPDADGSRPWTALPDPLPHAFDLYLDALAGTQDVPLVSVWEAADRVAVMDAMYTSARCGSWLAPSRHGPTELPREVSDAAPSPGSTEGSR